MSISSLMAIVSIINISNRGVVMFVWKKEFELGIDIIDEQHKRLLDIGNNINELIIDLDEVYDNYDEILIVIEELKSYTKYHFKSEEDLLVKYDYPDILEHKKEHEEFISYLESLEIETVDQDQQKFLKDLLGKVYRWVFNHIITTDFMYKDYLINLGLKP